MNPTCANVLELIDRFLDSDLPAPLASAVQQHLETCAKCRAEADLERAVKDSVARSCQEPAPQTLRKAVYQRLVSTQVEWIDGVLVERTFRVEFRD